MLQADYDIDEVAAALGMSVRWVRARIYEGAAHQRYGHKIKFTPAQVEELRAKHTKAPAPEAEGPITTGRKRKSA